MSITAQVEELKKAGCVVVFQETLSSGYKQRSQFEAALEMLEKEALVLRLKEEGCSYRSIRKQTGLALSTIRRIIVEQDFVREV